MERSELNEMTINQLYELIREQEDRIAELSKNRSMEEIDSIDIVFREDGNAMATRFIKIMRKNRVFNMSDLKKKVDMRVWSRSGYQRSEYFPIEAVANIGKKTALWAKEKYENYYRLNKSLDE